jgi:hypothetical protein
VDPGEMFVLIAITIGMVKLLTGPIGTAIGDRIRGGRRAGDHDPHLSDELDALRERVHQLEQMHPRLVELEERVDFAERFLAQPAGVHGRGEGRE